MALPQLLITRPAGFAEEVARRFAGRAEPCLSPLIRIAPARFDTDTGAARGLILTSRNGVATWTRAGGRFDLPVWAVGPATAEALRRNKARVMGVAPDAARLFTMISGAAPEGPLLHLRGEVAGGNLAARLTEAGTKTDERVIYHQHLLPLSDAAQDILAGERPVVVPLYSPRTARHFRAEAVGGAPLDVVAISAAAARHLADWPRARVTVADAPDGEAMERAVAGRIDAVHRLEGATAAK